MVEIALGIVLAYLMITVGFPILLGIAIVLCGFIKENFVYIASCTAVVLLCAFLV